MKLIYADKSEAIVNNVAELQAGLDRLFADFKIWHMRSPKFRNIISRKRHGGKMAMRFCGVKAAMKNPAMPIGIEK